MRILLHRQRFCDCVRANPFFFLRRKKNSEKERPLRGLRREVSPDLLRRTEMKSKAGAQCGSVDYNIKCNTKKYGHHTHFRVKCNYHKTKDTEVEYEVLYTFYTI